MKLGLYTYSLRSIPLEELLDLAQAAGIEAVELGVAGRSATAGLEAELLLNDSERVAQLQESVTSRGMVISAFNATSNPLHPNTEIKARYVGGLKAAIRLAAHMGVTRVITGAGCPGESAHSRNPAWVMFSEGYEAVLEWQWNSVAIPVWRELGAYAFEHGVRICIEVLPGTLVYNTDSFSRLHAAVGEAIGVNFDPSHLIWQGMDPRVVAREFAGCICHAHAKDTVVNQRELYRNGAFEIRPFDAWASRSWSFCALGDGHDAVFWRSVLTSMQSAGYDDVWSIEHEDPTLDNHSAIRRNATFMRYLV